MRSYTTIEQSKHLLELGLDIKTADMFYLNHHCQAIDRTIDLDKLQSLFKIEYAYPSWSLMALLNLIKPYKEHTYELKGTLDGGAMISFEAITCVMYQEEEPIDAVYEMVCWLIEKKYIE